MALKKADIVAALEKAGVQFDPEATVADLMPLYEALPKEGGDSNSGGGNAPAEEEKNDGKGEAVVLSKTGAYARTYTKAIHGKEYKDLAAQYAEKIGGSVRK